MLFFSLHTAVIMSVGVSVVMMLILFYLRHLNVNAGATGAWACAFACIGARHFCSLMMAIGYADFSMGADFFLLGFASFLWSGTRLFHKEPVETSQTMLWFSSLSFWILAGHLTQVDFFWRVLPVHLAVGAFLIATAGSFWRSYRCSANAAYGVVASVITLKGLHLIDFPFLREMSNLAPLGFMLSVLLDMSLGMLLLVVALMEQLQRAGQLDAALINEVDIRKQAADVFKEREALFEKVFQLVPDVLVICRQKDGRYIETNRHWEAMTGYTRSESIGKHSLEMEIWVDPLQRNAFFDAMQADGEVRNLAASFRHKNGNHYSVHISGFRFEVGGESFVVNVVEDVSAINEAECLRQSIELQLRERENRFVKIFDLVPEAISIAMVPSGILVDVNTNWEQLLGFDRSESLGMHANDDLGIWADATLRQQLMDRLEHEAFVRGFETTFKKQDGTIILVEIFATYFESGHQQFLLAAVRDITAERENESARYRAETALFASESHLRSVLNAMVEGVVVWGKQGDIVLANNAAMRMFGLPHEQMHTIHDHDKFQFFKEDGTVFKDDEMPVWKTLQSGVPQKNVVTGIKPMGAELRWIYLSTAAIFSIQDSAQVEQVVITMVDISQLKLAEASLRERESVLATVFQLVPDTLTITRMSDGHYVDVNCNWEPLSGFSREDALGHSSTELNIWVYPEQRAEMVAQISLHGDVHSMPITFRHKDGHVFQCRVSGSKFETSEGKYLLLSAHNIDQELATERHRLQTENLLRENEQKYSTLFQLSPIPLGLINMKSYKLTEVNDSWVKQFGYLREEVIGHTALELNFWSKPEQRTAMLAILHAEGKVDRFEAHHRHKDGQVLICLLAARQFAINGEEMFIFSLQDVTRQYAVEKEIREITTQLEARVLQRTLKLEQANTELADAMDSLKHTQYELVRSEKMAALGALVAGVAHELNTPIGNSVTVASTLQDKTRELLRDVADGKLRRSTLDHYLISATTGTAILMRTLGVARDLIRNFKQVAVDQSSSQRRQFDLKKVLEEIISTLAPMYKSNPYTLVSELEADIVMDSFPGPLGQILTNFMTNALAHAFEGRDQGTMRISSRRLDDNYVEIIFSDDGVGINEANQKRVFDPFFTTKLGQGGSGLGMNIVYNITTGVLGGTIRLETELGQGSRFIVVLPTIAPKMLPEIDG
ncbi:hypothetical protein BH11PSE12_BH11PSE12_14900 [soil metagenome]